MKIRIFKTKSFTGRIRFEYRIYAGKGRVVEGYAESVQNLVRKLLNEMLQPSYHGDLNFEFAYALSGAIYSQAWSEPVMRLQLAQEERVAFWKAYALRCLKHRRGG